MIAGQIMRVFFDQFLARSDESSVKNEIPFASRFAFRWTIFRATFYAELEKLISLGLSAFRTFRTFCHMPTIAVR